MFPEDLSKLRRQTGTFGFIILFLAVLAVPFLAAVLVKAGAAVYAFFRR